MFVMSVVLQVSSDIFCSKKMWVCDARGIMSRSNIYDMSVFSRLICSSHFIYRCFSELLAEFAVAINVAHESELLADKSEVAVG